MAKTETGTTRILGIDPGTNALGYAIIETKGNNIKLIDVGVVHLKNLTEQTEKLKRIFDRVVSLIDFYQPNQMAVEAPFFGKNVQSMLKLGRAQGVAMVAGMTRNLSVTEYAPKKIKLAITGNGNASKEQVAAMVSSILKVKFKELPLDATDALGTAICHHYQNKSLGEGKKYTGWKSFLKDNPNKQGKP